MSDWADEAAAKIIFDLATRYPTDGFGRMPCAVIADALRSRIAALEAELAVSFTENGRRFRRSLGTDDIAIGKARLIEFTRRQQRDALVSGEYQKVEIGNGTFYIGDCFDVLRDLPDGSVDVIVTDPPYRTISGGTSSERAQRYGNSILSANDGKIFKHNNVKIGAYMREFYRLLKPGSHCYVMTNNLNLQELLNEAESAGFGFHNVLVWVKNNCTANRWYMKNLEYTVFFYKKPARAIFNMGSKQTYFADNIRTRIHPTEKPVELFAHYLGNSANSDMVVLDPFGGSGPLAMAAEMLGLRWLTCEKDTEYAAKAIERIRAHVEQNNVIQFYRDKPEIVPLFIPVDSPPHSRGDSMTQTPKRRPLSPHDIWIMRTKDGWYPIQPSAKCKPEDHGRLNDHVLSIEDMDGNVLWKRTVQ